MRTNESGFSLVSVLIALTILSVGIMALTRTNFVVLRAQREAASRTTAVAVARAYLEELRGRDAATLASESPVSVDEKGKTDATGVYTRSVEVIDQRPTLSLKRVTVTVTGPRIGAPVRLVTNAFVNTPN
jgi:type IV pilus assembly protein PilV